MSQSQLENISLVTQASEPPLTATNTAHTANTASNASNISSTSGFNGYKPTLVKASKEDKEGLRMSDKENTEAQQNQEIRNNSSFRDKRNSYRINTSANSANSANSNSKTDLNRSIDIVSSTVARIEQLYLLVERNFVYRPNIEFLINAMIETGKFDAQRVAENICTVFSEKEPTNNRKSAIHLSESNLAKCREIQTEVRGLLEMDIDIHPIINSILYTGRFNARDIVAAVRRLFSEKRKTFSYQSSNRIN